MPNRGTYGQLSVCTVLTVYAESWAVGMCSSQSVWSDCAAGLCRVKTKELALLHHTNTHYGRHHEHNWKLPKYGHWWIATVMTVICQVLCGLFRALRVITDMLVILLYSRFTREREREMPELTSPEERHSGRNSAALRWHCATAPWNQTHIDCL